MKVKDFKTRLAAAAFAFAIVLSACSQGEPTMPKTAETSSETFSEYADVVAMASESYYAINSASRSANFVSSVHPWLKKDILKDRESSSRSVDVLPDTLLYIVNYSNEGGSVLVSDNEIFKGVVAVIDEGNIDPNEDIEVPGMQFYLESFCESLKTNKINETTPLSDVEEYLPTTVSETNDSEEWHTLQAYKPLLNAKWGQKSPYNKYCFANNGNQAVAGCGPIAMAQLLTYYKHPAIIEDYEVQWQYLGFDYPSSFENAENSALYVSAIGKSMNAEYREDQTTSYLSDLSEFLRNNGFNYKVMGLFSNEAGVHSIKEFGPFIVRGRSNTGAHFWVIDGVNIQALNSQDQYKTRFLFHCNWGWNGKYNGYFLTTAFDPLGDGTTPSSDYYYQYGIFTLCCIEKKL